MEPGFYWVSVTEPFCDGGGVLVEPWREPEVARFDGLRWFLTGEEHPVPDQITVRVLTGVRLVTASRKPCDACDATSGHAGYCTPELRARAVVAIEQARARRP